MHGFCLFLDDGGSISVFTVRKMYLGRRERLGRGSIETFMPPPSMDRMRTPLSVIDGRFTAIRTASFSPVAQKKD